MEGIEERIGELKNRTIEMTKSGQQRETRLKLMTSLRGQWACTRELTFMPLESRKKRNGMAEEVFKAIRN